MPVHEALLGESYLPEICQGPIRDCGRMTATRKLSQFRLADHPSRNGFIWYERSPP